MCHTLWVLNNLAFIVKINSELFDHTVIATASSKSLLKLQAFANHLQTPFHTNMTEEQTEGIVEKTRSFETHLTHLRLYL